MMVGCSDDLSAHAEDLGALVHARTIAFFFLSLFAKRDCDLAAGLLPLVGAQHTWICRKLSTLGDILCLFLNLYLPQSLPSWRTATQCAVVGWGQVQLVPSEEHLSPSHRPANHLQI